MDSTLQQRRRDDGNAFYCPNGHANYYTETEAARLKKQLEQSREETQRAEARAVYATRAREFAEKSAKGAHIAAGMAKADKRRLIARVHAGVCPHCHRTFKQLAAHMKSKHA